MVANKRKQWMIYGATGYSGSRTAERAVALGYQPVLAGRSEPEVKKLAERLGLTWESCDLKDTTKLTQVLSKFSAVLNAAGPFIDTYKPMIEACIKTGTHYLDISGEVGVYEGLASYQSQAIQAGIMIMPAVGFDMVPGDCLALMLKDKLPDARELNIAYSFDGTLSRGSTRTALVTFSPDTQVRRGGKITRLAAPIVRNFDFGSKSSAGTVDCYSATFGDISIGARTTAIPDITSYMHVTAAFQKLATLTSAEAVNLLPDGPSDEELKTHSAFIVGEARNKSGKTVRARLTTPQVYAITFPLAAEIAQQVHGGKLRPGFQTPAAIFGKDFILNFERCSLEWLES